MPNASIAEALHFPKLQGATGNISYRLTDEKKFSFKQHFCHTLNVFFFLQGMQAKPAKLQGKSIPLGISTSCSVSRISGIFLTHIHLPGYRSLRLLRAEVSVAKKGSNLSHRHLLVDESTT